MNNRTAVYSPQDGTQAVIASHSRRGESARRERRRRILFYRITVPCMITVLIMSMLIFEKNDSLKTSAHSDRELYYKSVLVEDGDTIWSIAKENMTEEWPSVQAYVNAIMKLNQKDSDSIYAGMYLSIPYYR